MTQDFRDGVRILTHAYRHIWDQANECGDVSRQYWKPLCEAERVLLRLQRLVAANGMSRQATSQDGRARTIVNEYEDHHQHLRGYYSRTDLLAIVKMAFSRATSQDGREQP